MAPTANVWISRSQGIERAVGKVAEWFRCNSNNYERRALLTPQKGDVANPNPILAQYISNGNVGSLKGKSATAGGPVLALGPTHKLLATAIHLANGQALGVVEHGAGEVAGWAAATGALNLDTGEPTPEAPPQIRAALEDLHAAGYNGYARSKEAFFKNLYTPPIETLVDAGYSFEFVASYLAALSDYPTDWDDLKKIYR